VKSLSSNVVYGQLVTIVSDTADVAGLNERIRLDKTSRTQEVLSKDCIRITSIEVIDVHPTHKHQYQSVASKLLLDQPPVIFRCPIRHSWTI